MALKKSKYTAGGVLQPVNVKAFATRPLPKPAQHIVSLFVSFLAELADAIATKQATHVTVGTNKADDALLLTVNWSDGSKSAVGSDTLMGLMDKAIAELTDYSGGEEG